MFFFDAENCCESAIAKRQSVYTLIFTGFCSSHTCKRTRKPSTTIDQKNLRPHSIAKGLHSGESLEMACTVAPAAPQFILVQV